MAITGIAIPLVAGVGLFAVDHVAVTQKMSSLQKAADAAAIASARELHFIQISKHEDDITLDSIAESYARQNMPGADLTAQAVAEGDTLVTVHLSMKIVSPFGLLFDTEKVLTADAKAEIFGGQNICIIAADIDLNDPGISLDDDARIDANRCGIYSNSKRENSVRTTGSSYIDAEFICASGGFHGSKGNVSNDVTTDCPQIRDPLMDRPIPAMRACDPLMPNAIGLNQTVTLSPGTYCGGLTIGDRAKVEFSPGIYSFKGGPLLIGDQATITGENVALLFEDNASVFEFNDSADIMLSAPETGPMAGIVALARPLCGDRARCLSPRKFKITSANVRSLLGTIYIPVDDLIVDTTMPVSAEAAFTILIVDNLIMRQSPILVLNTDYSATDVPVPEGFLAQPSTRIVQ